MVHILISLSHDREVTAVIATTQQQFPTDMPRERECARLVRDLLGRESKTHTLNY